MSLESLIEDVCNASRTEPVELFNRISAFKKEILKNPEQLKDLDEEAFSKLLREAVRYGLSEVLLHIVEFGNKFVNRLERALILGYVDLAKLSLRNGETFEPKWDDHHPGDYIFSHRNVKDRKEMVKVLAQFGLAGYRNKRRDNLLHLFACSVKKDDQDAVEIAEILLNSGISINEQDFNGITPLLLCIPNENIPLIQFLIEKGADVNQKEKYSEISPLSMAARIRNTVIIDLLLSNGATDVNARVTSYNRLGPSVLHVTCCQNSVESIKSLLRKGADISYDLGNGHTPFAVLNPNAIDYDECMIVMVKKFSKLTFENQAISRHDMNLIQKIPKARMHFENCRTELGKIAITKFYDSYSYYSVLKMSGRMNKLARLTKNEEFVSKFKENLSDLLYFESDLLRIFEEAEQTRDKLEIVEKRLKDAFASSLPDVVLRKLGENLNIEDLPTE